MGPGELFDELGTGEEGLSSKEASLRLEKNGPNRIREEAAVSPLSILAAQFESVLVLILLLSVAISAFLGEVADAIAIAVIVLLNAALGFMQEYKAEKAIDALKKMVTPSAVVFRDGKKKIIPAHELVVGDLIWLESGDRVPADVRLVSSSELYVDESALTGESTSVYKIDEPLSAPGRKNCLFMGTTVMRGSCRAVVFATGMDTEIGRIAEMVQQVKREQTPLQQKLDIFGKRLGFVALAIVAFMFVAGYVRGEDWVSMFLTAVSLAVAAIPEGLPAVVTIALAVGVQKMVSQNAIIRKLSAVETLGSTSVICTDKTGTLTLNEMTVSRVYVDKKLIETTGAGYEPDGKFVYHGKEVSGNGLKLLLKIGALCNDATLERSEGAWKVLGDSTEGALIVSAEKAGMSVEELRKEEKKIEDFPFDSVRKMMSVVRTTKNGNMAYVKGAPEILLSKCDRIYQDGKTRKLTDKDRKEILEENRLMAEDALRVLGMAFREAGSKKVSSSQELEKNLVFVGLQGMIDAPRPEARKALKLCEHAGIRVVMVTGDHKITATAIGRELGLLGPDAQVVDGEELDEMSDKELRSRVEEISIYARVLPEQKLRIIEAWRSKGKVVAMTGDGVNDAPALKHADIGVAMGITGTDVSKEASDMVLADDNFASIVAAVREGRGIYDNIRKFLRQMLGTNLGELVTMFAAIILNLPMPLIPIQILWMNLVTDGLPAIALSVDPIDDDIMKQKPRPKQEHIVSGSVQRSIIITGVYMCIGSIFIFATSLDSGLDYARTAVFTTLVFFQMFRVLSVRSETKTLLEIGVFTNPQLILAVMSSVLLQMIAVYYDKLRPIFGTVPLREVDFIHIVAITGSIFVFLEADKIWQRKMVASG